MEPSDQSWQDFRGCSKYFQGNSKLNQSEMSLSIVTSVVVLLDNVNMTPKTQLILYEQEFISFFCQTQS